MSRYPVPSDVISTLAVSGGVEQCKAGKYSTILTVIASSHPLHSDDTSMLAISGN